MEDTYQKYVLVEWPDNLRIKYHPAALRVVSTVYRSPVEKYMIPVDIWNKYKNSYYYPSSICIPQKTKCNSLLQQDDTNWDKFNKPTFYDEISVKIITQWIDNYKLLYQHQKKCPNKSEKPGLPKKSKLNITSLLQQV